LIILIRFDSEWEISFISVIDFQLLITNKIYLNFLENLVLINLGYHPTLSCPITVISSQMTISPITTESVRGNLGHNNPMFMGNAI